MNNIKLSKAFLALSLGAFLPFSSMAALTVSYDQMNYQALPATVLYPFSYQGLVSIGENNFLSSASFLPKIIPDHWDVVVVGRDILEQECNDEGQLESLDYDQFPHKDLLTVGAVQKCGVGFSVLGIGLNYSLAHQYGVPPTHWIDLFDFNRFPGKRALPRQAKYLFEAILLADGVQPDYLYPLLATTEGQDRVFNKLNLIYDDILWWNDVNNLKLWLEQGLVVMSVAPDGAMLSKDGIDNVGISRQQILYEMKYYAMLKESKQKDIAYAFISYATQPDQQLKFTNAQYYGTTIKQGSSLVAPNVAEYITNNPRNLQGGILIDYDFYAQHGEVLEERFTEWLSSKNMPVKRVLTANTQNTVMQNLLSIEEMTDITVSNAVIDFIGPMLNDKHIDFVGPQLFDSIEKINIDDKISK